MKHVLLATLVLLSACSTIKPPAQVTLPEVVVTPPAHEPVPQENTSPESLPVEALPEVKQTRTIKLNVDKLEGFVNSRTRIEGIIKRVETILNSQEFKSDVVNYLNPILKQKRFYASTAPSSFSTQQVYDTVTSKDFAIHYIAYCQKGTSTVGYTYANVDWVRINTCHTNYKTDSLVAKNLCHEFFGHKKGFIHNKSWSKLRDTSTPYKLGDFCAARFNQKLTPL